jgi:NAD(P)-dependent dehydrogenase (short-subunit alcohol dehydrogenase family)
LEADLRVTVLDLANSIERTKREEGVHYVAFDARDPESINAAAAKVDAAWEAIETFVFLSGFPILPKRSLEETSLEKWNELMSVNLTSAYLLTNALAVLLRKGDDPTIVTVSSSLGYQVMPGMGAYATSKGALVSLTKALAVELAPNIRVNSVAPGAVETDFLSGGTGRDHEGADRSWFDALSAKYVSTIPLARVAEPRDVVGPILFLAGSASSYMTGQVLHLNGGRLTP